MIYTKNLTIRRVAASDWKAIQSIWVEVSKTEYSQYDNPKNVPDDAVAGRIAKWASTASGTEHMFFAVCLDGNLIGYVAFNSRENGYETGYCFHSDYHGKGYAKESLLALIYAIHNIRPGAVITAGTAIENIPSIRLLLSLGFHQTGTEKVSFYKDSEGKPIYFDGGIFELDA